MARILDPTSTDIRPLQQMIQAKFNHEVRCTRVPIHRQRTSWCCCSMQHDSAVPHTAMTPPQQITHHVPCVCPAAWSIHPAREPEAPGISAGRGGSSTRPTGSCRTCRCVLLAVCWGREHGVTSVSTRLQTVNVTTTVWVFGLPGRLCLSVKLRA